MASASPSAGGAWGPIPSAALGLFRHVCFGGTCQSAPGRFFETGSDPPHCATTGKARITGGHPVKRRRGEHPVRFSLKSLAVGCYGFEPLISEFLQFRSLLEAPIIGLGLLIVLLGGVMGAAAAVADRATGGGCAGLAAGAGAGGAGRTDGVGGCAVRGAGAAGAVCAVRPPRICSAAACARGRYRLCGKLRSTLSNSVSASWRSAFTKERLYNSPYKTPALYSPAAAQGPWGSWRYTAMNWVMQRSHWSRCFCRCSFFCRSGVASLGRIKLALGRCGVRRLMQCGHDQQGRHRPKHES
jgi:hypothetical protein